MKFISVLAVVFVLSFMSCSIPVGSGDEKKSSAPRQASYFPLAIGSIWYYSPHGLDQPVDTSVISSSWQVVIKRQIGGREFYGMKRVTYDVRTTHIAGIDTTYFAVSNDSLFQIEPQMPLSESSVHLQAVFCESGYATFTWNTPGGAYKATLNARTEKTLTYFYWKPDVNEPGYTMTYQKGVGCYETQMESGAGSRLVRYTLK